MAKENYNIFGNASRVPKIRDFEKLTKAALPDELVEDVIIEVPHSKDKPKNKKTEDSFDSMVDADDLWERLDEESNDVNNNNNPSEDVKGESESDVSEEPQEDFKEPHFLEMLLDDPEAVWDTWVSIRQGGHSIAYDRIIEKPLNISDLKDLKSKLKAKVTANTASGEERRVFSELDDYLDKVNELGRTYLEDIKYSELHNKIGAKWLENKIRKMNLSGKKLNSDLLFFFFMAAKEAECATRLYEVSKNIPRVNL